MPVKLIVSDLDGTILPRSGRLGQRTRAAIAAARRRGIHFTLATGRLFHAALPAAAELGLELPIICCDGALIENPADGEILRELLLPPETAQEAFAQLFFYADEIFLLAKDLIYAAPEADETLIAPWGSRIVRFDPTEALPTGIQAMVAFGQAELLAQAANLLAESSPVLQATLIDERRSGLTPLVIRPEGADKGSALEQMREMLGLERDEIMAFGDWPNDLPMFSRAGHSVAPRDAHPAVRRAVDRVSAYTCAEECVAREVERVIWRVATNSRRMLARSG